MISRYEHRGGVWVDLEQPSEEEIHAVAREFGVSERLELELLAPTPAPLVASDTDTTLLIMHFPAHGEEHGETKSQEIDFIVGSRFIITVRYEVIAPLYHLKKLLETDTFLAEGTPIATDVLLELLFAHLYTSVRDHASHSASELERVEQEMFDGHERATVRSISVISREFLHLEAALANQEEPLLRFLKALATRNFFGPSFNERTARVMAERAHIARLVATYRAIATELRETNIALLSARQNEIMKTLTTITVIVLPLELIAFIFGMHAAGTPLESNPHAFWIIMAGMLATVGFATIFFAKKRWIF